MTGTVVEDTYCECTELYLSRVLLTSLSRDMAMYEALFLTGAGIATFAPIQGSIECFVDPTMTPDGRPGVVIHFTLPKKYGLENFREALVQRLNLAPHLPFCSLYDALPQSQRIASIPAGKNVRLWGDGFESGGSVGGKKVFRIPVMTGDFIIEQEFGVCVGVDGALEVMVTDANTAVRAMKEAAAAVIETVNYASVFNYPIGGLCGAKVGGINYKDVRVTTNHMFCPGLRTKVSDSKVPPNSNVNFEFLVAGLTLENTKEALKAAIAKLRSIDGVLKITAPQFSSSWGNLRIYLRDLL